MNLAAIYIANHDYLFDKDKPQTINFGGKYFYSFREDNNNIYITRKENPNYIEGFFNLKDTPANLTNINAIVGQNGAGKSTILDIIRSACIGLQESVQSKSLLIAELEKTNMPIIIHNDFNNVHLKSNSKNKEEFLVTLERKEGPQTIYYSPSYDYKSNSRYNYIDNHDISFESTIGVDLISFDRKENTYLQRELLFKNSLRHIEFLSSNLVVQKKIFQDLFKLPNHSESSLYFSGYKISTNNNGSIKFINTSDALRYPFQEINNLIERISDYMRTQLDNITSIDYEKYRMKQSVLSHLLSIIYEQTEKLGHFTQIGYFSLETTDETNLSIELMHKKFIDFIENCFIKINDTKVPVFNSPLFKSFIDILYSYIDNNDNLEALEKDTLIIHKDDAIKILTHQQALLNDLTTYYHKLSLSSKKSILPDKHKVDGIVNYSPFNKRLSSGENALLNLFSRLYDFLNSNLKTTKFRKANSHYIILLDEADLGFHLSWKKKYVKALLMTLPHFFDELNNKPTIQIIFTTHDPLTLSDLPNSNVIYIQRKDYDSNSTVLDYDNPNRPSKTFGANISDLIADSFFIEDSLIGNFAFDKIREVIVWLNEKENMEHKEHYKKIIQLIDEPIVQRKLSEMYDEKIPSDFQLEIIEAQIKKLEALKNNLKK